MGSVHLVMTRDREIAERVAVRRGLPVVPAPVRSLQLAPRRQAPSARYCTTCAESLEFGAVLRRGMAYCSFECSLGSRPA